MDPDKRAALESAGFRIGDAEDFLGMTPAEAILSRLAARTDAKMFSPGLIEAILRSVEESQIAEWLDKPHPMLGGMTPAEAIVSGKEGLVREALDRSRSGDPS